MAAWGQVERASGRGGVGAVGHPARRHPCAHTHSLSSHTLSLLTLTLSPHTHSLSLRTLSLSSTGGRSRGPAAGEGLERWATPRVDTPAWRERECVWREREGVCGPIVVKRQPTGAVISHIHTPPRTPRVDTPAWRESVCGERERECVAAGAVISHSHTPPRSRGPAAGEGLERWATPRVDTPPRALAVLEVSSLSVSLSHTLSLSVSRWRGWKTIEP